MWRLKPDRFNDMREILGRKLGMTRIFNEAGDSFPVTVIEAGPCPVVAVKTSDKNGYDAYQVGFGERKKGRIIRCGFFYDLIFEHKKRPINNRSSFTYSFITYYKF